MLLEVDVLEGWKHTQDEHNDDNMSEVELDDR